MSETTTERLVPLTGDALHRIKAWVRGYRTLVAGGSLSPIVHTAGTSESELSPGVWACLTVDDVERLLVLVDRIADAMDVANNYGDIDGSHHKQWVIDQMIRSLLTEDYDDWVRDQFDGMFDVGIAP